MAFGTWVLSTACSRASSPVAIEKKSTVMQHAILIIAAKFCSYRNNNVSARQLPSKRRLTYPQTGNRRSNSWTIDRRITLSLHIAYLVCGC
jgi:hypothetical protein